MMSEIIIDEEFQLLLPALDEKTYTLLEESLIQNGCLYPIVLWNNIIIDGHNRYEICTKHDIPFNTVSKDFDSRDDVLIWIISTQVARRNLSPIQLSYFRGMHFNADKRLITNKNGNNQFGEVVPHNEGQPKDRTTAVRLGNHYKVSRATIERDAKVATAINTIGETSLDAKRKILSGDVSISRKQLRELAAGSDDDVNEIAAKIDDDTFKSKASERVETPKSMESFSPVTSKPDPIIVTLLKTTENFYNDLLRLSRDNSAIDLKPVIKFFIDELKDLYEQISA